CARSRNWDVDYFDYW
nr:immunoglobulin heavy chain junction region [Mus musculus]NSM08209.1 immunoglobulin heavy chain junction region [Mus musculus]